MRTIIIGSILGLVLLGGLSCTRHADDGPSKPAVTPTRDGADAHADADAEVAADREGQQRVKPSGSPEEQPPAQASHSCAPSQVFEGRVVMKGELHSTKGAQIMLQGTIINMPVPADEEGIKRRAVNQEWFGRTVEIEGDRCVYHCPPQAQCLTTGSIPVLNDVKLLMVDGEAVEP